MLINALAQSLLLSVLMQSGAPVLRWSFETDRVGGLPARWAIRGTSKPVYRVETENGNRFISAISQNTDSQLGVEVSVRAQDYPTLSWRWRAFELPRGGDERSENTL